MGGHLPAPDLRLRRRVPGQAGGGAHFVLPLHLNLAQVYFLNPLAQNIEDLRHALVTPAAAWSVSITGPGVYLAALGITLACFGLGLLLFRRLAPSFAESL